MRKLFCVFCVIFPMVLSAKTTIDLFGDEGRRADHVLKNTVGRYWPWRHHYISFY